MQIARAMGRGVHRPVDRAFKTAVAEQIAKPTDDGECEQKRDHVINMRRVTPHRQCKEWQTQVSWITVGRIFAICLLVGCGSSDDTNVPGGNCSHAPAEASGEGTYYDADGTGN